MPTYQYECEHCQHSFEILQSMMDKKLSECPSCGQPKLFRLIGTGAGVIFKGSGFYETDYKKALVKGTSSSDKAESSVPASSSSETSSAVATSKES